MSIQPGHRLRWVAALALAGSAMAMSVGPSATGASVDYVDSGGSTPAASCAPGDLAETGAQGRVSAADVSSGRAMMGYTCNTSLVGHHADGGQFKTLRYVDPAGHVCAFYDTTQENFLNGAGGTSDGVRVLDVADPTKPLLTATLSTPAMLSPHESLLINQKRGLLVADMGTAATAPLFVDVYDLTKDCRTPVLDASSPLGVMGHESGFSPDGKTFYVTSPAGSTISVIDLTDPTLPSIITVIRAGAPHGLRLSDDGTRLYEADDTQAPFGATAFNAQPGPGLQILDVSQIQQRVPNPQVTVVSTLDWPDKSVPQQATPITVAGHRYLMENDEFSTDIGQYEPTSEVGAARIINIDDDTHPRIVSNIRLQVNTQAARTGDQTNDPSGNNDESGYAAHYCNVPQEIDPGIMACSFIRSGLRIFNIQDPTHPREVGYFNPPGQNGGDAYSAPAFDPTTHDIWYTDESSGFWVVHLTAAAWPGGTTAVTLPAATTAPAGSTGSGATAGSKASGATAPQTPVVSAAKTRSAGKRVTPRAATPRKSVALQQPVRTLAFTGGTPATIALLFLGLASVAAALRWLLQRASRPQ